MSDLLPDQPAAPVSTSRSPQVPDKVTLDGLENKWDAAWTEQGTYRFDATRTRPEIY